MNAEEKGQADGPLVGRAHQETLRCPDCGAEMKVKYGVYGPFYGCVRFPTCKGSQGARRSGKPVGAPADRKTKDLRARIHGYLDPMWSGADPEYTRDEVYQWAARLIDWPYPRLDVASLDFEQCQRVLEVLARGDRPPH